MIATDDQQLLAGRSVPPWRIVVHAAIAHVHAIDDGIAKRPAALDDPPTHEGVYIVIRRSGANRAAQMVRVDHCERVEGLGASAPHRPVAIQKTSGERLSSRPSTRRAACVPSFETKGVLASLLATEVQALAPRSQSAARSLRVSTRGTAHGAFLRSSKSGDGRPSPSTHQANIFDARRAKIPSDGGAGGFDGSGPTAEPS